MTACGGRAAGPGRSTPGVGRRGRALCVAALLLGLAACDRDRDAAARAPGADASPASQAGSHYREEIERWRAQRVALLRAPMGWLSYTGSGRLRAGTYRVGSAQDNDVVLPGGPAQLGTLRIGEDGAVGFEAAPGAAVMLRGRPFVHGALNTDAMRGVETRLSVGEDEFYVVDTGAGFGWRFRDPSAQAREAFRGIDYFPIDRDWRVVADWHPASTPQRMTLLTSIGTPQSLPVAGEARFEIDGRSYRLHALREDSTGRLFFPFSDRTSGRETYGGARYLFVEPPPRGERIVLDFNRAQNPPCAFTAHVVCPIAPVGNRLDLAVTAGEKSYFAAH